MSLAVRERTQRADCAEGARCDIGATLPDVLRDALAVTLAGTAAGLIVALLKSPVQEVQTHDGA